MTQTIASDTTILLALATAVTILTVAMETLARRGVFPQWLCRKLLHLGAIGACAVAPVLLADLTALTVIVAMVTPLLLFLVATGRLFLEPDGRPSWGIALFPLPYLALLLVFPGAEQRCLIALPMAILAVSDSLAGVVGSLVRTPAFTLSGDRKTVGGSLTFAASTWLVFMGVPCAPGSLGAPESSITAVLFAILVATFEALGSRGRDNLYIPAAAAMLLIGHAADGADQRLASTMSAVLALPVAVLFIVLCVRLQWLTLGGAVAAALLGVWVIYFQGVTWLLPLAVFLVSSSVLGRLLRARSASGDSKHGKPRDAAQVFANGGIYGISAALLPAAEAQLAMCVCMTVAAADTWASEIGIALEGRTLDLVRLKPVPVGLSGGVSVGGSVWAAGGALLLALVGAALLHDSRPVVMVLHLALLGVAGMLLDSVLGSLVQVKFRGASGALQDSSGEGALQVGGLSWMSNDAVNLVSTGLIAGLGVWLLG